MPFLLCRRNCRKTTLGKIKSQTIRSKKTSLSRFTDFAAYGWTETLQRERVSKVTLLPASLTVEAALGLGVFLIFMISVCQLFLVMQLQLRVQRALEQVGEEAAQYAYLTDQIFWWDSESVLLGELQHHMMTEVSEEALRLRFLDLMGDEYLDQSVIRGGSQEISFAKSSVLKKHHRIQLVVRYPIELPVALFGIGPFWVEQQCYRYGWLGDVRPAASKEQTEEMVYITQKGEVYHRLQTCSYLRLSVRAVAQHTVGSLRNQSGGKYYACHLCKPGSKLEKVYITEDGTRFHGDRQCSGIRREVSKIPYSQVGDRRPCSRCSQKKDG